MKAIKYIFSIFFILIGMNTLAVTFDAYYPPKDNYPTESITLKAGTIIKVMNLRNINTFVNDIGDDCEFINVTDMFVKEYLILPKNSHLYGTVEDIREPVQGNNGAIKIKVNKIVTPNEERVYNIEGYIGGNDFYIGGEQTAPKYYKANPHYNEGWGGGILQMTPLNIYEYGKHTQINAGQELFVILVKDLKIF